jgi:hypothetical protein
VFTYQLGDRGSLGKMFIRKKVSESWPTL